MDILDIIDSEIDPWAILKISPCDDDKIIQEAWTKILKSEKQVDLSYQAYRLICNQENRDLYNMLQPLKGESPKELGAKLPLTLKYCGPQLWYESLNKAVNQNNKDIK